ncbi:MAG TPA: hypothetical protein ENK26_01030, partial [Gammaproteobacteria bacterium]|nr:hypothetical protein [Gammaproteobacteria bacterium]
SENTTAIFLESAYFNPVSIRKTAKRFGLNTDASPGQMPAHRAARLATRILGC